MFKKYWDLNVQIFDSLTLNHDKIVLRKGVFWPQNLMQIAVENIIEAKLIVENVSILFDVLKSVKMLLVIIQ